MTKSAIFASIAALSLTPPAIAGPVDNSADQVASLMQAVRVTPRDGGAYTELANAYVRAGQTQEAQATYRRVLSLDNVMLETATGDAVWSHEIARKALAQSVTLPSR